MPSVLTARESENYERRGNTVTNTKRKLITALVAVAAIVVSFVCGTVAYFTDTVTSRENVIISTGSASVGLLDVTIPHGSVEPSLGGEAINILPGYTISKTVTAKNTGTYPLYVRVKLSYDITLDARYAHMQGSVDKSLVSLNINTENWVFRDGYYYYVRPLPHGETAPALMTAVSFSSEMGNMYKDSTINFDIAMQVVQSNNNGTNVFEAAGWPSAEEGGQ